MFGKRSTEGYREMLSGIRIKTLVHGERTLMSEFLLEGGRQLPSHDHPYEQAGYLVSGRIRLHVAGESRELGPGDSWCIASGVAHCADALEDSVALEIFSPAREDYLKFLRPEDVS
jgi:quercetin dioxygenase-like cupin family protein